ncbi:MAG: hypothetical protein CME61_09000 [Halobacteriovoraceae bacterium]|nr:hypothetical protein [Halobacteriovoraceae bacterium]
MRPWGHSWRQRLAARVMPPSDANVQQKIGRNQSFGGDHGFIPLTLTPLHGTREAEFKQKRHSC